jgi:four helix bundle protein
MAKKSFHDLAAFQRAVDLTAVIYEITGHFPTEERYGLTAQLRRAAVRVGSDIAEGQGRLSYGEWRQMLSDARGSLFEVDAQCEISKRLKFLDEAGHQRAKKSLRTAAVALNGLIRWVREMERATKNRSGRKQSNSANSNQATERPKPPATEQPSNQQASKPSNQKPSNPETT